MDTNSIIEFLGLKFQPKAMEFLYKIVAETPYISVMSEIEVLSLKGDPDEYLMLVDFVNFAKVIALERAVIDQTILLRQLYKMKTPDAIIAATALVNKMTLITRNTADFKKIEGLMLLNAHEL
ncbi:MAG: type II toxin-antitoxin system VapC family toxin [Bacteroidota bacterium]